MTTISKAAHRAAHAIHRLAILAGISTRTAGARSIDAQADVATALEALVADALVIDTSDADLERELEIDMATADRGRGESVAATGPETNNTFFARAVPGLGARLPPPDRRWRQPCPFCGEPNNLRVECDGTLRHAVECRSCTATGSNQPTFACAVRAWNTRDGAEPPAGPGGQIPLNAATWWLERQAVPQ